MLLAFKPRGQLLGPLERRAFGIEDDENADTDHAQRHQAPECDIEDFRKCLGLVAKTEMAEPFHVRPSRRRRNNGKKKNQK